MRILLTGGAGFIGSHVIDALLRWPAQVTAVDNFDPFYSATAKERNIARHHENENFRLERRDIRDFDGLLSIPGEFDVIIHLAARAGVRPSIKDPIGHQEVNVQGTQNMLEFARRRGVRQFVFASSSSVYGINPDVPWREDDAVLRPISPYASTKVSGELLGHVYSHLYGIRFIGLRFFTVYGPRQRPDLAIRKFIALALEDRPIPFFGNGGTRRDYTYIDDIVSGILAAVRYDRTPYEIVNLGNNRTVTLADLVSEVGAVLGRTLRLDRQPEQPGDVPQTWADIRKAERLLGYRPCTELREGLTAMVDWMADDAAQPNRGGSPKA